MTRPPRDGAHGAIASAAAAIIGGLVVAVASLGVAFITQHGENERAAQLLDRETRGAARVLVSRFATTSDYATAALKTGEYLSFAPEFTAPLSPSDLKLIAGRLNAGEYLAVDRALRDTTSFFQLFEAASGQQLNRLTRENLRKWIVDLRASQDALAPVADLSE